MTVSSDLPATRWPFIEAERLTHHIEALKKTGPVIFQTGFGASGLPHIGTFAEIVRTSMVRRAFEHLNPGRSTRLQCFSDDMDALRKVPENVPQQEMLTGYLGMPLTAIPNPFEDAAGSFAGHNNARMAGFIERFGFEAELLSATELYRAGRFDAILLKVLAHHEVVAAIIRAGMGNERASTYSPFLPLCPDTGQVLQAKITGLDVEGGTINYLNPETGQEVVGHPVTGGQCKLQWKADWAMRWAAFGVDYEMAGKDLRDSLAKSGAVVKLLDGQPPVSLCYELFLDENGEKISKSRGNGVSLEDWLAFAPQQSLAHFMVRPPRRAQRLSLAHIPREVDAWLASLETWRTQSEAERFDNPLWYQGGAEGEEIMPVSFSQMLNLAAAAHAPDKETLWGFLRHYAPGATPEISPRLDALVGHALAFYRAHIAPTLKPRPPSPQERTALLALAEAYGALGEEAGAAEAQQLAYDIGKAHGYADNLRDWFRALYQILIGREEGARFGSFAALYGLENICALIKRVCAAEKEQA